jgi:hypothetical protein
LLDKSSQRPAHGLDGIRILGIGRRAFSLEVRPLTLHLSPFDVGLANEFMQKVVRVENALANGRQNKEWLFIVVE